MENARYLQKLTDILKTDERLIIEGELNKNRVAEMARKYDMNLLNLLQSDDRIKAWFFTKTDSGLVFKKDMFLQFLSNKEFLPDSYTAYKNKIGLATSIDTFLSENKNIVLNWPYKDCLLEGGQDKEDAKRSEIFFNKILAPDQINRLLDDKVFTNWKRYTSDGESILDEPKAEDNLIIKGNNLVVLQSLKKRYAGRVKLIYIDPPFYFSDNKSDDSFKYNTNFKLSTWLTFMRNRLELAEQLLRDDGLIFVHVGVEDAPYINILMEEIFRHENFVNHITMTTNDPSGFKATGAKIFTTSNHLFIYKKSTGSLKKLYVRKEYDEAYKYVILNKDEPYEEWQFTTIKKHLLNLHEKVDKHAINRMVEEFAAENPGIVFRTAAIGGGARKKRLSTIEASRMNRGIVMTHPNDDLKDFYILNGENIVFWESIFKDIDGARVPAAALTDVWSDISWTGIASEGGVTLKNGKKPEKLLKRIIELATDKGDLVLDYHVGSGTTAAVAHKMGRQYIGIEQLEYGDNDPVIRLQNVIGGDQTGVSKSLNWHGGGSFVYAEIKNDAETFRARIEVAKNDNELLELLNEATKSSFLSYRIDPSTLKMSASDFMGLSMSNKRRVLNELIDDNTLYVNYSDINDKTYDVSEADKQHNREFYGS